MAYREVDELAERRAAARAKLRALAADGAAGTDDKRAQLPFRISDTPDSFLDGEVVGRIVIRAGMRRLADDDFELMRRVVARLWPLAELARGDGVIAIFAVTTGDAEDNHRRIWSVIAEALPALHQLQPIGFVTVLKQGEPSRGSSPPVRTGPGLNLAVVAQPEKLVAWLIPLTGPAAGTTAPLHDGANVLAGGLRIDLSGRKATLKGRDSVVLADNDRFSWDGVDYVFKATVIEASDG